MKSKLEKHRKWIRFGFKIVILIVIIWLVFGVFVGLHRVNGISMSGRIEDGDLILFSRTESEYHSGDAVVFTHEGNTYVSSILAKAGDTVTIDEVGRLYVNNIRVSEEKIYDLEGGEKPTISLPYRVPSNSYFVLNKNLEAAEDSRSFGAIFQKDIKGKAMTILRTRAI